MKFITEITVNEIEGMQMGSDLMIAGAAWVSTGKDEAAFKAIEDAPVAQTINIGEFQKKKLKGTINFLMSNRHGSPFEHGALTVRVHAPIFVWREWHRHRVGFSYNEESARYHKLEPVFYLPPSHRPIFKVLDWKPGMPKFLTIEEAGATGIHDLATAQDCYQELHNDFAEQYANAYACYEEKLEQGFDPGLARDCLPVGIFSSCWVTCNPRSIMHFLSLRVHSADSKHASYPLWEIDQAAQQLEEIFKKYWPITHAAFVENGRVAP